MRIATYIHPGRMGPTATGVGKHIERMVAELGARGDIDVTLLAALSDWTSFKRRVPDSPLSTIDIVPIRLRRALIEKLWSCLNAPAAEVWTGPVDWVYCPMETYIPTRGSRLALTSHSIKWFDTKLPDLYRQSRIERLRWRIRIGRAIGNHDVLWLAVSEFLKRDLIELFGIRPERIAVVGNGIEDAFFAVRGQASTSQDERPYLLAVGGLQHRKGADYVLRLADRLAEKKSDLQIKVVGEHEIQYAREASAKSNVQVLKHCGVKSGLPQLMADSVALLNLSRHETFGIPLAEGMAAGTVVIAANNSAMPEIVGDGGILVEPTDTEHVADVVISLVDSTAFRSDLISRGRRQAAKYTWKGCCDRLIEALRNSGSN